MGSRDSPRPGSVPTSSKTKQEEKIERNRRQMGSLLLRKSEGLRGVSSGSIVEVNSYRFPECKWCLLTSDLFPSGEIQMNEYVVEFWNTSLSKTYRLKLKKIAHAQPNPCHRSKDGLVLIPISNSVFDKRRTFPTDYYNLEGSNEAKLHCYVMGSIATNKDSSLEGEAFTLMARTKKDNEGRPIKDGKGKLQFDYELRSDDNGIVCKTHKDFRSHLCPQGGVILKGEGKQAICIGVLNFSSEGLVSPVFFTRDTLTSQEQFFYPSSVVSTGAIANPVIKTQVDASPKEVDLATLKGQEKSNFEMKQQRQIADQENRLLQNVNANNYQIRQVNIPGDGNCLFHAVADQLQVLEIQGHTHESLRQLAVQELKRNEKDNHLSMDLAAVVPNNDVAAYLKKMSCDGTSGGHMELVALSHALKKTIKVVTSSVSEPKNAINVFGDFLGSPVLLGHLLEYHYKSLEPLQPQNCDRQGLVKSFKAALSLSRPHSVVTGRKKATPPQYPATVPESGSPSLNEDATRRPDDYIFTHKEQYAYFQNNNFLTTQCREKCEELNQLQHKFEIKTQQAKHLDERLSEVLTDLRMSNIENDGLRSEKEEWKKEKEKFLVEIMREKEERSAEKQMLLTKIKEMENKIKELSSQKPSAVIGDDSLSSICSNKVEEEEPPESSANSRQRVSGSSNSSEEEYHDALDESDSVMIAPSTL